MRLDTDLIKRNFGIVLAEVFSVYVYGRIEVEEGLAGLIDVQCYLKGMFV
jgi:hypothetical protein